MGDDYPPGVLAMADQELADCNRILDELVEKWTVTDYGELDAVRRVASFMAIELYPHGRCYPILALALGRLADGT